MATTKHIFSVLLLASLLILVGCKKDLDSPPVIDLPVGNIITIDSARNIYTSFDTTIVNDISLYGIITADEVSGNIYKELYIQDGTNAIKLGLTSSSNLYIGDRIRVALKGSTILRDNNMITIEGLDPDIHLIKQSSGNEISPEIVTINDLAIVGIYSPYQGKLVQINNVEFDCAEMCNTWANSIDQSDENRNLNDTAGSVIIVRSSGFANFAGTPLPSGQGSIIAVVSQYSSTVQLTIRNLGENDLIGARKVVCPFLDKDFNDDNLISCGWMIKHVSGPTDTEWEIYSAANSAASVSNYDGVTTSAVVSESWLISPAINLTSTANPTLSFQNVVRYSLLPELDVLVSVNYDGTSNPNTATWTDLTSQALLDTDDSSWATWTSSGNISLTPYKQTSVHIGFRLTGNVSASSTWEIDDVLVKDN